MKTETCKLFESMQSNLNESAGFEWLDKENVEAYSSAEVICGMSDLYFGETAEDLGVTEEQAIKDQAQRFGVEILRADKLDASFGGAAGSFDIIAKGAPNNIAQFFSNGEFDTLEGYLRAFDLEVKIADESDVAAEQPVSEEPTGNYETAEEVKAGVEKSGGLYQFIYDEWHNLPEEMKREIALNAVYELNNDAQILADLAERLSESIQNYSPDEDDLIDDEEDDEYYSPDDDPQGGMRYPNF